MSIEYRYVTDPANHPDLIRQFSQVRANVFQKEYPDEGKTYDKTPNSRLFLIIDTEKNEDRHVIGGIRAVIFEPGSNESRGFDALALKQSKPVTTASLFEDNGINIAGLKMAELSTAAIDEKYKQSIKIIRGLFQEVSRRLFEEEEVDIFTCFPYAGMEGAIVRFAERIGLHANVFGTFKLDFERGPSHLEDKKSFIAVAREQHLVGKSKNQSAQL